MLYIAITLHFFSTFHTGCPRWECQPGPPGPSVIKGQGVYSSNYLLMVNRIVCYEIIAVN